MKYFNKNDIVKFKGIISIKKILINFSLVLLSLVFFAYTYASTSNTAKINGCRIIVRDTTFENINLDLKNGNFLIVEGATLTINNSTISVSISTSNPYFALVDNGKLILKNNIIKTTAVDIPENPNMQSLYYLLRIRNGKVDLQNNKFDVDRHYCVGLLVNSENFHTSDFIIQKNEIRQFHGGIYLIHSSNADVSENRFFSVSFGNIFNLGNNNKIIGNKFSLPGKFSLGDAIDIVDSENVIVKNNFIANDSCYGMQVLGSRNIYVDNNYIINGITYGIQVFPLSEATKKRNLVLRQVLANVALRSKNNENIYITNNYLSQNRFAITAESVNSLLVKNNIFIQKFNDAETRKFWTNNDYLLTDIRNLTWEHNFYKEAFSQASNEDNRLALQLVEYPARGGVILSG